jgi:hypothetical protein
MIPRLLFAITMVTCTLIFSWGRSGGGAALLVVGVWALLFVSAKRAPISHNPNESRP